VGVLLTTAARQTFDRLVHVETMLWNRCNQVLRRRGCLPLGRLEVLRVIAQTEHCRVNDVSFKLLITVGAASKLVDRLEASGHCGRLPNPNDRRSSLLGVTAEGWTALSQAETLLEPLLEQVFAAVHLPQLGDTLALIEQVLADPEDQHTGESL
jgi:DNA-binding MarR family transcriptional regulator